MSKKKLLAELFGQMFFINALTFGGGYVIISFMKKKFVDSLCWLSDSEMSDYTAMAQVCPGSLAINMALIIGNRMCGAAGMLVALLGALLPPVMIITAVFYAYSFFSTNIYIQWLLSGMQSGVAAVLADVAIDMVCKTVTEKKRRVLNIAVMALTFISITVFGMNVVYAVLCCIFIGCAVATVESAGRSLR